MEAPRLSLARPRCSVRPSSTSASPAAHTLPDGVSGATATAPCVSQSAERHFRQRSRRPSVRSCRRCVPGRTSCTPRSAATLTSGMKKVRPGPPYESACQTCCSARGSTTISCASDRKMRSPSACRSRKKVCTSGASAPCTDVACGSKVGEPRIRQWRRPNVNRPIWTLGSCWPIHRATSVARRAVVPKPTPSAFRIDTRSSSDSAPRHSPQPHCRTAATVASRSAALCVAARAQGCPSWGVR
mmetsp:Transcript_20573/g.45362  ORF Transcript_20573/g.45362 Transcript_20573/m.45362 type:complete len:243 (-) Transcript_20573:9-737(-)